LQIIQYTGSLSGSGLTVHPNSQWNISVTVDTGAQRVNIHLLERLPLIAFTTPDITVSNSLQLDMQGVLNGFPTTPVYYEVHTSDGRLRDFGAMPPDSNWNIKLRHLREGTNTVRVFTLGVGGVQEEDRRQVVLKLGANPRVRPRPWPTEIWWGGVATGLAPDYGFAQLVDPAKPWDFVKQYQDGFFLHGILPQPSTLAKLSDVLAPYTSRFGQEGGFYVPASTNAGIQAAAAHTANHLNLTAAGIYISFVSLDWNPRLKPWNTTPGWVETWPNWTHNQLLDNNMQCWDDLVTLLHDDWPGLKIGQTWSPVWFNWGGYPALIPSGDNLTLNPAKDVNGNVVTNASGNPVSHVFDMQEFFGKDKIKEGIEF